MTFVLPKIQYWQGMKTNKNQTKLFRVNDEILFIEPNGQVTSRSGETIGTIDDCQLIANAIMTFIDLPL